ncbi:unnamed protein product [Paramecium sonneborni]|uniref:Uncharacterized protein n=1 Tax=Paramecium sonneborni TaxID=65129 RepID=A0A8S1PD26_9CILI|nr:unnamed protein product [Paramecium sonneborni]
MNLDNLGNMKFEGQQEFISKRRWEQILNVRISVEE